MPVLAVKTVKIASLIKDRQVGITSLWPREIGITGITISRASGTNPISHAVGRQGIQVPGDLSPFWAPSDKPPFLNPPKTTISYLPLPQTTAVETKTTGDSPFCPWRFWRETKSQTTLSMNSVYFFGDLRPVISNAGDAKTDYFGDGWALLTTPTAQSHIWIMPFLSIKGESF